MMRRLNVVLTAAAAVTLSAAPLSAQWGILGRSSGSSNVPRGHLPPPGQCRVWIDGVPPGRQPSPTSCRTAERQRPYYEQRYGRRARVIYGDRSHGVYDRNGGVYDRRSGSNCRYVERVIAGRVIRQRVCDNDGGVYRRDGVYDRDGRVYDRNGNVVYRRDGIYRDSRGRVYDRDSDSDSDRDGRGKAKGKNKNKNKGNGRGNGRW